MIATFITGFVCYCIGWLVCYYTMAKYWQTRFWAVRDEQLKSHHR